MSLYLWCVTQTGVIVSGEYYTLDLALHKISSHDNIMAFCEIFGILRHVKSNQKCVMEMKLVKRDLCLY